MHCESLVFLSFLLFPYFSRYFIESHSHTPQLLLSIKLLGYPRHSSHGHYYHIAQLSVARIFSDMPSSQFYFSRSLGLRSVTIRTRVLAQWLLNHHQPALFASCHHPILLVGSFFIFKAIAGSGWMGIYGIYSPRLVYYTMRHKETWGVVLLGLRAFLLGGGVQFISYGFLPSFAQAWKNPKNCLFVRYFVDLDFLMTILEVCCRGIGFRISFVSLSFKSRILSSTGGLRRHFRLSR